MILLLRTFVLHFHQCLDSMIHMILHRVFRCDGRNRPLQTLVTSTGADSSHAVFQFCNGVDNGLGNRYLEQ